MKNIFLQFGLILAILLTGCAKPGDAIINVSKTSSSGTEEVSIRVSDLNWRKKDGSWQGRAGDNYRVTYTPRDARAVKAIDKYKKF